MFHRYLSDQRGVSGQRGCLVRGGDSSEGGCLVRGCLIRKVTDHNGQGGGLVREVNWSEGLVWSMGCLVRACGQSTHPPSHRVGIHHPLTR